MDVLIEAKDLSKKFKGFIAVNRINFKVYNGECVGFLGPNGAGKTTTVRMIYGFSPLSEGKINIGSYDITVDQRQIKALIGVAPQENNLDPDFSVIKNLEVYARYFGIPKNKAKQRAIELLNFFDLQEKTHWPILELSTGMKRRLVIARALINNPKILILDEPTTGVDPQGRQIVWDKIRSLRMKGVTIILTTHYMDEATALCDRVLIIDSGKIIEQGEPYKLIKKHVGSDVLEFRYDDSLLTTIKAELPKAKAEIFGDQIRVFATHPHGVFEKIRQKYPNKKFTIRNANLEDVFLKLTGRNLRE